ncbi:helix-turn-helix domain-containing protein [Streptomyces sp. NPDC057253]|uniref:helix-turn-helix domain-containing protein n=1 Tax=Streptomyces sp. NPDC057253 TaxID=3346069 RepID=UPI00363B7851
MTRWRPLPDALPREARLLVEQLRQLKDRTDLSLAELARRTAYSKSSWQRYLSGAKQPPRGAVRALCRVAGADQARLLALWELADPVWPYGPMAPSGPPGTAPGPGQGPGPGHGPPPGSGPNGVPGAVPDAVPGAPAVVSPEAVAAVGPHAVTAVGPEAVATVGPGVEHRRWRAAALVAFAVIVLLVAGVLWAWPSGSG